MEEKKQELLKKLKELKTQVVCAIESQDCLMAVDVEELNTVIELMYEIFDAERKPGFTLRRADGTSVTVETECVSIQCIVPVEEGCEGTMYNSIKGSNSEMLALAEMQSKAQERLLKSIGKSLLAELDELLGGNRDESK